MPDHENATVSILHLEDNALDAELTAEVLAEAGVDCELKRLVHLEDFQKELADYPSNWHYDMVLADYKMPGYDGMTALKVLRTVDRDLPFVLLSGALGEELAVELLRNGATDYVLKHNLQRLPLVIRRAIDEHETRKRELKSQKEIRQARDDAEQANSAKGRFLGRISHELRTPLNAILGYTQLMQSDPMSEEQKHCADQILKAGEHLLQLINEVLDITLIESGRFSVNVAPTSLTQVIERAADLIRPMARESGIHISLDSGPCDTYAMVDRDRLAQILLNLLTNAVKYNRPGGHVYVECQEGDAQVTKIEVRDTGLGISPSKMQRLFTPFDRLDAERDTTIPGTGLGLTVSKALLEAMGGKISVFSVEGQGTAFILELPRADTPASPEAKSDSYPSLSTITSLLPSCNILLVEDDEGSRDFLERVFARRCNVDLTVAASVEEALVILQTLVPQVIITDLNFPQSSGEDLIKAVKSDNRLKKVPVIVTTIDPSSDREAAVRALDVADYFKKPIHIARFFQAVSHFTRQEKVLE